MKIKYISGLQRLVARFYTNRSHTPSKKTVVTNPKPIAAQNKKLMTHDSEVVRPEQVIPFDQDEDFKDF